jgi:hypothetical protein
MIRYTSTTLLLLAILVTVPVLAGDEASDQQAGMERWMKAATPGEFHEFLAKKAGSWNIAGKMWMEPGGEPQVTSSTGEAKMILGGRFLYETMEGSMMGMPVEGLGITGYDNSSGVVTSIWYDNTGTVTTVLKGKWEKPGAPLELHGEMWDPMSGLDMKIRTVTTFISADESVFEYFASAEGLPEMKAMELRYTRAK